MPIRLRWEGSFFANHSLALVNREVVWHLSHAPGFDLSIRSAEADPGLAWDREQIEFLKALDGDPSGPVDVHVRHQWPLNPHPPREGKWVIMQPWEYGSLPRAWYEPMRFGADEVWVYSTWNKQCYIESGIPEEKIHVVPLGVHPAMLGPSEPFPLRTRKTYKFLFVGGTIMRKGIDLLLDAYIRAFTREDDVCLVIKDFGVGTFYGNQTHDRFIRELQANPRMPEIEYLSDELTPERLRDLYHACDCLVHPFRGEGFGLPIAEAMACGLPVIVPDQGGASDFCTPDTALLLPSRRVPLPPAFAAGIDTIGAPWWVEVRPEDLRARMREVYERPLETHCIADRGRQRVRESLTWEAAGAAVADRVLGLGAGSPVPLRGRSDEQHRLRMETGVERWRVGDAPGAIRQFGRAREEQVDPDALYNLAVLLIERGDHATAQILLQAILGALSDPPADAQRELFVDATHLLGVCRAALGNVRGVCDGVTRPVNGPDAPIRWWAPMFNATGYADESRGFLLGLHRTGAWNVRLEAQDPVEDRGLIAKEDFQVLAGYTRNRFPTAALDFQHSPPSGFRSPAAPISVARTMFETDRIADPWVDWCNQFTEVWIPTEFNRETFARAGVVREKLRVVPGSLDARKYAPANGLRAERKKNGEFRFLSVFDFTPRKGWDILLRAYFEEFEPGEPVSLTVKVVNTFRTFNGGSGADNPEGRVRALLQRHGFRRMPRYRLINEHFSEQALHDLYRNSDAFVLPSRGEGWGRPYMDAMAFGLPTLGTRWSGNLEFMHDGNSFLIDIEGLDACERTWPEMPFYAGHQWAEPSIPSTRRWMRHVFENREEARQVGVRARDEVLRRFDQTVVAEQLKAEFRRLLS